MYAYRIVWKKIGILLYDLRRLEGPVENPLSGPSAQNNSIMRYTEANTVI